MPRFVVVRIDDNEVADAFISEPMEGISFVGMFGIPTKFCECEHSLIKPRKILRGSKMGWWVHKDCAKPVKDSYQHPRNLLDPDKRERAPLVCPSWVFMARSSHPNPGD